MFGLENSVVDSLMIRSENHFGLSSGHIRNPIVEGMSWPRLTQIDLGLPGSNWPGQWTELILWTLTSVTICVCLFIAIFFKILNMVLEYRKKKSNRPDEIVYLVSSSNRPRASRIDEGRVSTGSLSYVT